MRQAAGAGHLRDGRRRRTLCGLRPEEFSCCCTGWKDGAPPLVSDPEGPAFSLDSMHCFHQMWGMMKRAGCTGGGWERKRSPKFGDLLAAHPDWIGGRLSEVLSARGIGAIGRPTQKTWPPAACLLKLEASA